MITDVIPFDAGPKFMDEMAGHYQPRVIQAVLETPQATDLEQAFLTRLAEYQPQNGQGVSEVSRA